jgi:hypothetical protein
MRFSMRDLMWGVTLLAVLAAWGADHRRQVGLVRREKEANVQAAAEVQREWLRRYRGEAEAR